MSETIKKITIYDTPKKHADLKIRWKYDDLGQSEFFRVLADYYLAQDERIMDIIKEYQKKKGIQSGLKRKKTKKLYRAAEQVRFDFALKEDEVESIFDLLAEEHPDL